MQRHVKLAVVGIGIAGLFALFWSQRTSTKTSPSAPPATTAEQPAQTGGVPNTGPPPADTDRPTADAGQPAPATSADLSQLFPDGKVPPLPKGAPQVVHFGVALLVHEEAEGAPKGARSKAEAKRLADTLLVTAQKDFGAAVKAADAGSVEHAGRMPRGVLDPVLEYVLFTLQKGEVAQSVVDTPKGFWVVRRD